MRLHLPLRRRLLLSVIGAVALALVILIGAFNIVLRQRLGHEADSALVARASAELASLNVSGRKLIAPEVPDAGAPDAQAWVFAGDQLLEQPRSDPRIEVAGRRLIASRGRTQDIPGAALRLYALPVVFNGQRLGTVVAAISLTPYENSAQTALIASIVLGALLLAMVAVAAWLLIRGALRPVALMTTQAAAWSDKDSEQRFNIGAPRDEFTQLAATLDGLLDRVAASLRHEQNFTAEISHELRSPLASVIAEAQFALRHGQTVEEHRAGYERVLASAQQMRRTLEVLLAAARIEHRHPHASGDAVQAAEAVARGCGPVAAEGNVTISVNGAKGPVRVGVETELAERVLAPLVENGCRYGASSVTITVARVQDGVRFTVQDDGPGVPGEVRDRVFEPGWRGPSANGHGAGLGLPLARRLARAAGGDVVVDDSAEGGRFSMLLPAG